MNRIEELMDAIEEYVMNCKTQAFSSTKIICEREALLEMIRELRARMPEELTRVQKIMANQEAIMANAREKAGRIVEEAEAEAAKRVDEQKVMKDAVAKADHIMQVTTERANGILHDAIGEATNMRIGAINYTDTLIGNIQTFIEENLSTHEQEAQKTAAEYRSRLEILTDNRQELQRQMAQINGSRDDILAENTYNDVDEAYETTPADDISDIPDLN